MKYKVIYEIEVDAESHRKAALKIEHILKNAYYRPHLIVTDENDKTKEIDLELGPVKEGVKRV